MGIKYISDVKIWFDRINGNTYHSVDIKDITGEKPKLIFSSGLTYGYGEAYKQTTMEGLNSLGLLDKEDFFNYELLRGLIYYCVKDNCKKSELKKLTVD